MIMYGEYEAYTHEELLDEFYGHKGTPERDAYDAEVAEDIRVSLELQEKERAKREKRKSEGFFNTLTKSAAML